MSAKSSNNLRHYIHDLTVWVARSSSKKSKNWRLLLLFPAWVTIAYIVSNRILAVVLFAFDFFNLSLSNYLRPAVFQASVAIAIYVMTIAIVIGIPYYVLRFKTDLKTLGMTRLPSWSDIGLTPVAFVFYSLIVVTVFTLLSTWWPSLPLDQNQDTGFQSFGSQLDNMLAFLTLVIMAPIAEEVLFRGYLYGKLKRYTPVVLAALVSSLLFALAHMRLNVGIDVFILGLVLCGLRSLTGSIWAGVLVHMLKNAIAYYLLFVSPLLGG